MPDDSPLGISCHTLCSAISYPIKRGWIELEPRGELEKRYDQPWPPIGGDKGKDDFMVQACNALTPDQELIPSWASTSPGYASAVTAPLDNSKVRFGTQEICGCTMLFVVSRKRVYLGKFTSIIQRICLWERLPVHSSKYTANVLAQNVSFGL